MTPFIRMRRDLARPAPPPVWPAGCAPCGFAGSHIPAMHALLADSYRDSGGAIGPLSEWEPALLNDPEFDPGLVFLTLDETGVLSGLLHGWTGGFVKDVAVARPARRRGVGRALMLAAFAEFRARGLAHADLKVRPDNAAALAFYQALGMYAAPADEA